jgi:hypothetical protein
VYHRMAYGTESGVVVIDIVQRSCVLNMVTPDLYGSADPYQRVPRSPKRLNESSSASEDRCRSPSTDQVHLLVQQSDAQSEATRSHWLIPFYFVYTQWNFIIILNIAYFFYMNIKMKSRFSISSIWCSCFNIIKFTIIEARSCLGHN